MLLAVLGMLAMAAPEDRNTNPLKDEPDSVTVTLSPGAAELGASIEVLTVPDEPWRAVVQWPACARKTLERSGQLPLTGMTHGGQAATGTLCGSLHLRRWSRPRSAGRLRTAARPPVACGPPSAPLAGSGTGVSRAA